MARTTRIPAGARLEARKNGTIVAPGETNDGKRATIELYSGHYSQGYKSNFERVETVWFRLNVVGEKAWCFQYSGRNLATGRQQFTDCAEMIAEAEAQDYRGVAVENARAEFGGRA